MGEEGGGEEEDLEGGGGDGVGGDGEGGIICEWHFLRTVWMEAEYLLTMDRISWALTTSQETPIFPGEPRDAVACRLAKGCL